MFIYIQEMLKYKFKRFVATILVVAVVLGFACFVLLKYQKQESAKEGIEQQATPIQQNEQQKDNTESNDTSVTNSTTTQKEDGKLLRPKEKQEYKESDVFSDKDGKNVVTDHVKEEQEKMKNNDSDALPDKPNAHDAGFTGDEYVK